MKNHWSNTIFLRAISLKMNHVFNRPCVAGAVLQTPSSLHRFIHSFIHSLSQSSFSSKSSKYQKSQTIRGSWNFERMFSPYNMSHVPLVTCHMSYVMCHISHVTFFLKSGGPTPSSFLTKGQIFLTVTIWDFWWKTVSLNSVFMPMH